MQIDIAIGRHSDTKSWEHKSTTWDWLVQRCSTTFRTPETVKQYDALGKNREGKDRQNAIKSLEGAFVGGMLLGGSRAKSNVLHRQVLCLDADTALPSIWRKFKMLVGCSAFMYTTHKHTPGKWRVRIVILLDREVTVNEYEPIARRITATLGIEQFDKTTYDFNRYMYFPTTSSDGEFLFEELDGEPLDCDAILGSYRDYLNEAEWPLAESENKATRHALKILGDPLSKPGIIGAFCRVYNVKEAIAEFLSDVYEPTDTNEDRYTYTGGSTSGGLVVYDDDLKCFSNHGTDPMSGKGANAFDLCRVHLFGDQDSRAKDNTPVNRLPSHLAMEDFAMSQDAVREELMTARMAQTMEDFSSYVEGKEDDADFDPNWIKKLESDKKGNVITCARNFETILENDPRIRGNFGLNMFSGRLEAVGPLPWNAYKKNRIWSDDDWKGLRMYMSMPPYVLTRTPSLDDVMGVVKYRTAFHPVQDYIKKTAWDGTERVESLLIDYLGAEDSEYVRTVTRKTLLAAVTRIFKPGCKFEYVLTMVGPEGRGKSEIIKRLGGQWYSSTFSFSMLSGGNGIRAIEQIQGVWIIEIPEMSGLKKAEANAAKSFLGGEIDIYRPSHGQENVVRPRQCIFMGSTNNKDFLTSADGNRRFWPVTVLETEPDKSIWDDLTKAEVAQIWAEAYQYYLAGEQLHLPKEIETIARQHQGEHEEKDEWFEIIRKWLDEPIENAVSDFGIDTGKQYRRKVCAADVWEFALLGDKKGINTQNTKRIHTIMRSLPDWREGKSKAMFEGRTKLIAYYRKGKTPGNDGAATSRFNLN